MRQTFEAMALGSTEDAHEASADPGTFVSKKQVVDALRVHDTAVSLMLVREKREVRALQAKVDELTQASFHILSTVVLLAAGKRTEMLKEWAQAVPFVQSIVDENCVDVLKRPDVPDPVGIMTHFFEHSSVQRVAAVEVIEANADKLRACEDVLFSRHRPKDVGQGLRRKG
jgi:hypothetical protein